MEDKTYCLKHYRQTFPDKGCDICKLEEKNKELEESRKWHEDTIKRLEECLAWALGHIPGDFDAKDTQHQNDMYDKSIELLKRVNGK